VAPSDHYQCIVPVAKNVRITALNSTASKSNMSVSPPDKDLRVSLVKPGSGTSR